MIISPWSRSAQSWRYLIVIPTTSGTGSEVTNVAVIKSKAAGRKVYIVDPFIVPRAAIRDPPASP